jgi:polysaccharide export outer membrane protein
MATRRRGKLLAGFGALLGLWTTGSGCQTTGLPRGAPPAVQVRPATAEPQARAATAEWRPPVHEIRLVSGVSTVIGPRTEVQWSVEAEQIRPGGRMAGVSVVGPNGAVEIGPYGSIQVAGLTPAQARLVVEKHLARYLARPRVALEPRTGSGPLAWRGSAPDQPASAGLASAWRPAAHPDPAAPAPATAQAWRTRYPSPEAQASLTSLPARPATSVRTMSESEAKNAGPELLASPKEEQAEKTEKTENPPPAPEGPPPVAGAPSPGGPAGPPDPVPRELSKKLLPPYVIEPPDILLVESTQGLKDQPIVGQHAVRPDGTISLGIYGSASVGGLTLDQARAAVAQVLAQRIKNLDVNNVSVDVLAYNSKYYYIITDGGGYGEQVYRVPVTGSETVLDAISLINGLPPVSDKRKIWVARRHPGHAGPEQILPVDWIGITQHGSAATNYQMLPGDRIYVKADRLRTLDALIAKVVSPIERILGVTLLGSETVNSIAMK